MFTPHQFGTLVHGVPKVVITPSAFADMWVMVDEVDTEVGWLGTAVMRGPDIIIEEVFLMEQECDATETNLTEEGITQTVMSAWVPAHPVKTIRRCPTSRTWAVIISCVGFSISFAEPSSRCSTMARTTTWRSLTYSGL